jgi:hypothetical protein
MMSDLITLKNRYETLKAIEDSKDQMIEVC